VWAYANGFGVLAEGLEMFILRNFAAYRKRKLVLWEKNFVLMVTSVLNNYHHH
jgi:hypothetical protein